MKGGGVSIGKMPLYDPSSGIGSACFIRYLTTLIAT